MHAEAPWAGHDRGELGYRRLLLALFAAGFATFGQVFTVQAVLPDLSEAFGLSPADASLSLSVATLGMALSVLPWASIADRIGRVNAIKWSLAISAVLGIVGPLMPTFEAFLVARGAMGVALGAVPAVAMAYLAEEVSARHVAGAAAVYVAGNTVGGVIGRVGAATGADIGGWHVGLLVVAAITAALSALFFVLVPAPRGYSPRRTSAAETLRAIRFHLRDPLTLSLYLIGFLNMGGFAGLYNYVAYRVTAPPFSLPTSLAGLLFVIYLLGTASARVSALLSVRRGVVPTMLLGFALEVAGALLTLLPSLPATVAGLALFTIGCFLVHPLASGQSGARAQFGRAQSSALFQLSWLVGTGVLGWVIGTVLHEAGWAGAVAVFVAISIAAASVAWVGLGVLARRRPTPPPGR
ncbi:MFS transporter [Microbacterium album]|uniref:Transporter n=1 Tax=Microbacterium album TaxID=2053191 RepID=A0A917MM33_9MICO|nr:MFS transporter [Microbacterium album]GGH46312.1 putative transporter [Microbacterium album]